MKKIILLFSLTLLSTQIIFSQNNDFNKIKELMTTQSEAWNRGDIDGFMTTYWKSEKLQFIGSKGITYGWKNTLDRYKKSYPSKETMGFLTFDIINLDKRSRKVISVVGKWHLKRDADLGNLKGHFLSQTSRNPSPPQCHTTIVGAFIVWFNLYIFCTYSHCNFVKVMNVFGYGKLNTPFSSAEKNSTGFQLISSGATSPN